MKTSPEKGFPSQRVHARIHGTLFPPCRATEAGYQNVRPPIWPEYLSTDRHGCIRTITLGDSAAIVLLESLIQVNGVFHHSDGRQANIFTVLGSRMHPLDKLNNNPRTDPSDEIYMCAFVCFVSTIS